MFCVSFAVFTYTVATVSIWIVPPQFPFGLVEILPLQYWIAVALSTACLFLAISARATKYAWLSAVLLVILVAGLADVIFQYPRAIFSTTATERISGTGTFNTKDEPLLNFPGSVILFSFLVLTTGIKPVLVVRVFGVAYNLVVLLLAFASFKRLGIDKMAALLAALIAIFSFYLQGVLVYSSLLGFLFYIVVFQLILAPYSSRTTNMLLVAVFFATMVVSHAFSPFLTLGALGLMLFAWKLIDGVARKMRLTRLIGDPPLVARSAIVPLLLILVAYWAYLAVLPFSLGLATVTSRDFLALIFAAVSPLVSPQTVYARAYASVVEGYPLILFPAFIIFLIISQDKRKIQLLLWMVGLAIPLVAAVSGYVQEFLVRMFAFAILPLSYGVGRLFDSKHRHARMITIAVLLITLGLHVPAHYGQDSFLVVQDSTIKGLQFLGAHSSSDASLSSPIRELYQRYYVDIYRSQWVSTLGTHSYFVMNYKAENWVLYTEGDRSLMNLIEMQNSNQYDRVYSNGLFQVYLEN